MTSGDSLAGYWLAGLIREVLLPEVVSYEECVTQRVLRSFDRLDEESNEKANALLNSVSLGGEDSDYDSAATWARDKASNWASTVSSIYWGMIALLTGGLFHLFEQQVAFALRESLQTSNSDYAKGKQIQVDDFTSWLKINGIDVGKFPQWPKINQELRAVANVAKHAEGGSATTLRVLRPDLFTIPGTDVMLSGAVDRPIAGDGMFVPEDEFKSYAKAVRKFWAWLAAQLDDLEG
jgi:hypothetical protein